MTVDVDRLREWCERADLPHREEDGDLYVRLDPDEADEVCLELDDEGALRLHDHVALASGDLPAKRLSEVVEDVVLGRSSLVDARVPAHGVEIEVEVVLVVHAEGLNRHTFLEAVFEVQKVRLLLHREVAAAVAAEETLAALAAVAGRAQTGERSAVSA